jgi:ribose-phosphate pyrophosphokinase
MALLLLHNIRPISFLTIAYLPYARQDRACNRGEPLSIQVIAQLINSIEAFEVELIDPHSDVAGALIKNSKIITQDSIIHKLLYIKKMEDYVLVAPDAGAYKKLNSGNYTNDLAFATKVRDKLTGKPTIKNIEGDVEGRDCLIVDDICDGGRTFIELAKKLKEQKAKTISLYTTYGIYSNGIMSLEPYFDKVYYKYLINNTYEAFDFLIEVF